MKQEQEKGEIGQSALSQLVKKSTSRFLSQKTYTSPIDDLPEEEKVRPYILLDACGDIVVETLNELKMAPVDLVRILVSQTKLTPNDDNVLLGLEDCEYQSSWEDFFVTIASSIINAEIVKTCPEIVEEDIRRINSDYPDE